ncbi:MAG: hypothetical protein PHT38_01045 [Halothiobacillus sp.]|nr:hypothetical protein [Halothiobacillus sp.]
MKTYALTVTEGIFYQEETDTVLLEQSPSKGSVPLPEFFEDTIEVHVFSNNEAAWAFEGGLALAAEMYGGEMMYLSSIGVFHFAGKLRPAVALRYGTVEGEVPALLLVDNIQEG